MLIGVNEVFETVQGEAFFTGSPAVFVRLQGCLVGCPWCDTKHTWAVDKRDEVSQASMMQKTQDAPTHARMAPWRVANMVAGFKSRLVVITGGEPAFWPLRELCEQIQSKGKVVQIETSGTEPVEVPDGVWVTVSPKIGMPGGKAIVGSAVSRANEIKMPVGKPADVDKLIAFIDEFGAHDKLIWLQPLSQSVKATELCLSAAREHGWRVSIQTHKFLGVR
jgi:7-carboxy-7-deazaguanine synthase